MTDVQTASRWKRPIRIVPLVVLVLAVLGLVAYRFASKAGVKRQLETIRAAGLPTSEAELDRWYQNVPAKDNAALAFLDAYSLYVQVPRTNDPSEKNDVQMVNGEPLPPILAERVRTLVDANREAIEELHKAARLTESRYPINLTKGYATLLPHLAGLRKMSQLLRWEAVHQSASGNKEEALKAIYTGFALAASLDKEPLLISSLVRIAMIHQILPALERLISEQTFTDAELEQLTALLLRTEEQGTRALQRAIIGERAAGAGVFQLDYRTFEASSGGGGSSGSDEFPEILKMTLFELRRVVGLSDRDKAFFLTQLGNYSAALDMPYPDRLRMSRKVDADMMEALGENRIRYMISGMMLPSLEKGVERDALLAGQLRCAQVALAMERFRLREGKLPSLNELVPGYLAALPVDPVDGTPLEYEKLGKGYWILAPSATELKMKGKKNETEVAFTAAK